jgi:hypothetical protein
LNSQENSHFCLAAILFPADFKLSLERARSGQHDIAAQTALPLPCFDQFFVGQRLGKLAVYVFAEFVEHNWLNIGCSLSEQEAGGIERSTTGQTMAKLPSPMNSALRGGRIELGLCLRIAGKAGCYVSTRDMTNGQ